MDDPELHSDETVLLTTPDVFVKSVPFEAILTNKRIILVDRRKNIIPPKDILLATIRDVQPGENAIRDPNLAVSVITSSGETKQVVLTFPQRTGGVRTRERDEWAKAVRDLRASSAQRVIRTVMPDFRQELKRKTAEIPAPVKIKIVGRPQADEAQADDATGVADEVANAAGTGQPPQEPDGTAPLPYGTFCTRCGNRLSPGSLFCNRCGAKVVYPGQETIRQEPEGTHPSEPVRAPAEPPGEIREHPVRKTAAKPAAAKAGPDRKDTGFFSRIFKKKKSPKTRQAPSPETPERPPSEGSNRPGSRRRLFTTLAVVAVIVLVIAGGVFVYLNFLKGSTAVPDESSGVTTAPTQTTTTLPVPASTVTIVRTEATPVPIPTDGVYVRVSYIGAWTGSYGVTGSLVPVTRSGEVVLQVENATGTVQAAVRKNDASTRPHELVAEIYKNGALVKRGVTTESKGQVDISVNIATATPVTVTATVTQTAAATTPAGNTTAT